MAGRRSDRCAHDDCLGPIRSMIRANRCHRFGIGTLPSVRAYIPAIGGTAGVPATLRAGVRGPLVAGTRPVPFGSHECPLSGTRRTLVLSHPRGLPQAASWSSRPKGQAGRRSRSKLLTRSSDSPYREIKALLGMLTPPISQISALFDGTTESKRGLPPIKNEGDVSCCRTYAG